MFQSQLGFDGILVRPLVTLFVAVCLGLPCVRAETWTSLSGSHSVDAKLIGVWGENVILELTNGRRVSVKLDTLRSESRIQAQELGRKLDQTRAERIMSLQGQASSAAAPAPNPLPIPPAAPNYTPPQPNLSAADFFAKFDASIESGHVLVIYDSLPPSYRNDIDEVVKATARQIDPATWHGVVGTLQRLGDLIETRQKWFVSSPRVKALPADQIEVAEGPLLTLAGLLRVGLTSDAMHLDQLQSTDFRTWLQARDGAVAPYLARLFQQIGAESLREVSVESENNGTAVASIDIGGTKTKVTYVTVEGYWVPKTLADQWAATMQEWKQSAETPLVASVTAASTILQAVSPTLDSLATAGSAGEFHAAMEGVFTPAETLVTSVAGLFGGRIGGAGSANAQGGSRGGMSMMQNYRSQMMGSDSAEEDARRANMNYGQNYGQQPSGN